MDIPFVKLCGVVLSIVASGICLVLLLLADKESDGFDCEVFMYGSICRVG